MISSEAQILSSCHLEMVHALTSASWLWAVIWHQMLIVKAGIMHEILLFPGCPPHSRHVSSRDDMLLLGRLAWNWSETRTVARSLSRQQDNQSKLTLKQNTAEYQALLDRCRKWLEQCALCKQNRLSRILIQQQESGGILENGTGSEWSGWLSRPRPSRREEGPGEPIRVCFFASRTCTLLRDLYREKHDN